MFLEVGNTVDDHVFGITSTDEVLKEYEIEDGKIVLFKKVHLHYCYLLYFGIATISSEIDFYFLK